MSTTALTTDDYKAQVAAEFITLNRKLKYSAKESKRILDELLATSYHKYPKNARQALIKIADTLNGPVTDQVDRSYVRTKVNRRRIGQGWQKMSMWQERSTQQKIAVLFG